MKRTFLIGIITGALALAPTVRAEQSGAGHYMSGQQSDFSTLAPSAPGFYFANFYMNYNDGTFDAAKDMPFGSLLAANVTLNTSADVPAMLYAYPLDFFGGTLSSGIFVPFAWVDVKASATFNNSLKPITRGVEDKASGLGDIELSPVMASWTNGDFHFNGMFNVWAPSGSYSTTSLANTGLGYWTFEPMVAASWISSKFGTEVTVFSALDFNTENTDANYQSGDIFHMDGTVAQHLPLFGGLAGAGATAFYLQQITGDSGSGAKLGSFEAQSYGVGPTISYVHPVGKSTLVFDGSWLPQLHSENTTKGDFFWAKVSLVF